MEMGRKVEMGRKRGRKMERGRKRERKMERGRKRERKSGLDGTRLGTKGEEMIGMGDL